MRREEVVHYHEVDLPTVRYFYSVETVELRYQSVWIAFDMRIILAEDFSQ